jgi:hypothetical protein
MKRVKVVRAHDRASKVKITVEVKSDLMRYETDNLITDLASGVMQTMIGVKRFNVSLSEIEVMP